MEVKDGLLQDDRKELISKFSSEFKRVALVVVGDPPAEYKKRIRDHVLKEKQAAADKIFQLRQIELQRKKTFEKNRKAIEREKRRAEMKVKRKIEAAKRREEEEKLKLEIGIVPQKGDESKTGETEEQKEEEIVE